MFTYSKYIIWRIVGPFILVTLTLTSIVWLTQSLRFIELIVNRGLKFSTFLYLSSLTLPSLLWIILPTALFISIMLAYQRLMADSELIAFKNAGISAFGLMKPMLITAAASTLLCYIIGLYLLPASYREFKDLQTFIRDNYISVLLQEGVFVNPVKGLTVYIRERGEGGKLKGLMVHDERTLNRPSTMMAEQGQLVQTPRGPQFILQNGNRQEFTRQKEQLSLLFFDRYVLELNLYTEEKEERWREPKERFLGELFEDDPKHRTHLEAKLRAEAHHRITWPLYNILLGLMAISLFVAGEFNRRGQWQKLTATTIGALTLVLIAFSINNAAADRPILAPFIYLLIFGGIAAAFYMLLASPDSLPHRLITRGAKYFSRII